MYKQAILSLSGGLDSTSLLMHLINEGYFVKTYSFDYGQKHKIELDKAASLVKYLNKNCSLLFGDKWISHEIIDLKSVFSSSNSALTSSKVIPKGHYEDENMKDTVVENRNAIFAAIIYGKALSWSKSTNMNVEICLGIHSGDHAIYPDCRPEFRDALNHAFKIGNWGSELIGFYTPFLNETKGGIVKSLFDNCIKLDLNFNEIVLCTNTCYHPHRDIACGECGSCIERIQAFDENQLQDWVPYQYGWTNALKHAREIINSKNKDVNSQ
jgi:7-cyano-7-deazaguanine synthase